MNASQAQHSRLPKAATGIDGLDAITEGGLPAGRPTLLCGAAGCGKTLFGVTFLVEGALRFDEPGILMTFEERPEDISANVASLGYKLPSLIASKKLVIDQVKIERGETEESGTYDLEGLFVRLGYAIDKISAKRVVLDTIENLFGGLSDSTVLRSELRRLFTWLKEKGVTTIITGERGDGQLTRHGLEEYVSDCVILLDNRVQNQITTRLLRVATENRTLDDAAAALLGDVAPGRYVVVTLTDTGTGMPQDVVARVFEAFFTTKEVGKGSGLGLSQVYGFARQSGGHVAVQSEVGKGTSVRLYLPWTEPVQVEIPNVAEGPPPDAGHYTKVLIVEDDNDLRDVATHLVVGLGYGACSASGGAEAIAKLEMEPDIGLVFTDILMPGGMSGFELAAEIRRRRPEIPILMTSGFPGHFLPGACESFPIIRKPFTQIELASAFLQMQTPARRAEQGVKQ